MGKRDLYQPRMQQPVSSNKPVLMDVARVAGVSTASVSRVINTPHLVKAKTRQKVEQAILQLGYVPDAAARALKSGQQKTLGVIVPTLDNAIFARGISAFQRRLAQQDYTLLVASSDYQREEELREVHSLVVRGVDALMLIGAEHPLGLYQLLRNKRIPYVNTWVYTPDLAHPSIGFDNYRAAKQAADFLLDLGHTRIAMIAGITAHNDRAAARVKGVKDAMQARGVSCLPELFLEIPYDVRQGREAFRQLLPMASRPTAVVCGNDVIALGVLFEAQAQGLAVPAQLSIIGFDDLPISANVVPALTTIRVPASEMGERAADYLLKHIARNEVSVQPMHTELAADLIVRGTTGPCSNSRH